MTVRSIIAAPTNASSAGFRAWAQAISNAITDVGFVRVSSPEWDSATAPSVAFSFPVSETFRFDDSLHSSHPIFFTVEYGAGSDSRNPGLRISVGKGFTGGALTDVMLSSIPTGMVSASFGYPQQSNPHTHRVSSCPSKACLVIVMNDGSGFMASPTLILERSRDNHGAPTGDGFMLAVAQAGGGSAPSSAAPNPVYAVAYDSGQHTLSAVPATLPWRVGGAAPSVGSSLATGVIAPVLPWVVFAPGLAPWQPLAALSYAPGDAVGGSQITVRTLGADRRYRVVAVDDGHHGWGTVTRPYEHPSFVSGVTGSRTAGLLVLWEEE